MQTPGGGLTQSPVHLPPEHSELLPRKHWPPASRWQTTRHVAPAAAASPPGPVQSRSAASGPYESHAAREAQESS